MTGVGPEFSGRRPESHASSSRPGPDKPARQANGTTGAAGTTSTPSASTGVPTSDRRISGGIVTTRSHTGIGSAW